MRIFCLSLVVALVGVTVFATEAGCADRSGEVLYNGIRLPSTWPPEHPTLTRDKPFPVPYLKSPPEVIPIDVGRQLFVDDFLIERTSLKRKFHKTTIHPASPVLHPDKPWERTGHPKKPASKAAAMVFSGGVFFDPEDKLFKAWYMSGYCTNRGLAVSKDGVHWEKPLNDVVPGTNIVSPDLCDTAVFWLDLETKDRRQRYKMLRETKHDRGMGLFYSSDGVHWGPEVARTGGSPSPTTFFWNPFRKVWVYSVRSSSACLGRYRRYWETPDPAVNVGWDNFKRPIVGPPSKGGKRLPLWVAGDNKDLPLPGKKTKPEIYNLDAVGYESVMLGLFSMYKGFLPDRPKIKEITAGFSRDGFHWDRPFRDPIIGMSPKDLKAWNAGNMQSAGGCVLVVGDKLYFYVSGRTALPPDQVCTTGLAVLRRDGFASMDAGASQGVLTTRPVTFGGKCLFVNVDAAAGELRAEVLDKAGNVIPGLSRDQCLPVRVDKTLVQVRWKGGADLSAVAGKPVRLRFALRNSRLYAFWVSPNLSGASYGYVGAGGPGFPGQRDTVGRTAYRVARDLKNPG